jgi:hypothetical protein
LIAAALRNLISATNGVLFPAMFANATYVPIVRAVPLWIWTGLFAVAGTASLLAAVLDNARLGRYSLIGAAALTFTVGFGLLLGATSLAFAGHTAIFRSFAPEAGLGFVALAACDYFVLTMPWLRAPIPHPVLPSRGQP